MKNIAIFAVAALLLAGVGAFAWNQVSNNQENNEKTVLTPQVTNTAETSEPVVPSDDSDTIKSLDEAVVDTKENIEDQIENSPIIAVDNPNPEEDTEEATPADTATTPLTETTEVEAEPTPTPAVVESEPVAEATLPLTAAEVANHKNVNDCWTIVNNNVYDITGYIADHPGGITILNACGTDGTDLFENQGGHSGSGHSPQASEILASYLLGALE